MPGSLSSPTALEQSPITAPLRTQPSPTPRIDQLQIVRTKLGSRQLWLARIPRRHDLAQLRSGRNSYHHMRRPRQPAHVRQARFQQRRSRRLNSRPESHHIRVISKPTTSGQQHPLQESAAHHDLCSSCCQLHQQRRRIQPPVQHIRRHLHHAQRHSGRIESGDSAFQPRSVINRHTHARNCARIQQLAEG